MSIEADAKIAEADVVAMGRREDVWDDEHLLGGPHDMTISARIGRSIAAKGWASYVPWPASWRQHFANSIAYFNSQPH